MIVKRLKHSPHILLPAVMVTLSDGGCWVCTVPSRWSCLIRRLDACRNNRRACMSQGQTSCDWIRPGLKSAPSTKVSPQFLADGSFLLRLLTAATTTTRGQSARRRKSEEKRLHRQEYIVRIILAAQCSVI